MPYSNVNIKILYDELISSELDTRLNQTMSEMNWREMIS